MRELSRPRPPDPPQGRFRPRPDHRRVDGEDRRRAPGGPRRAAVGRRPRHHGDAALLPADRRVDGAGVHDRAARRDADRHDRLCGRRSRARDGRDIIAIGPGLGQAASTAAFVQALVDRSACPWCSMPTRSTRSRTIRSAWSAATASTSSSRPTPARWPGCSAVDRGSRPEGSVGASHAISPPRTAPRRPQGASHRHRRPDGRSS